MDSVSQQWDRMALVIVGEPILLIVARMRVPSIFEGWNIEDLDEATHIHPRSNAMTDRMPLCFVQYTKSTMHD